MEVHGTAWNVFLISMELHEKSWTSATEQRKHAVRMTTPLLKVRLAVLFTFFLSNLLVVMDKQKRLRSHKIVSLYI
jgi:hypothetical protein